MKILLPTLAVLFSCSSFAGASGANATLGGREDVETFISQMVEQHGFEHAPLRAAFAKTQRIDAVIKLIMPPKDPGIRSWQVYRSRFIEPKRIAAGRQFMLRHQTALDRAEARWGVPKEVIAAIIGVETIYGKNTGKFGTFAALATLAFDYPPRADLFRRELTELLLLAREEGVDVKSYKGSYAGALGLPQFLPSSRRSYAVDFDGNGRVDLLGSAEDAIGSVANFLAEHGWQRGQAIADTVIATGEGLPAAIAAGIVPTLTPKEWKTRNMTLTIVNTTRVGDGETAVAELPAALIDLVTPNAETEYRLGYRNFYVITRYNRSTFYAASVMDLAAELRQPE
jgi:membrane-bound lytic murein transglycosylase B